MKFYLHFNHENNEVTVLHGTGVVPEEPFNCPVCDGGPNGHTFGCPTLPHNAGDVLDLTVNAPTKKLEDK